MNTNDDNFFTDSLGQKWRKDFFIYVASVTNLIVNQAQSAVINIESDSQFVWTKTSYLINPNAAVPFVANNVPYPRVFVSVTDSGSGRQLQNAGVPLSDFAGREGLPFVLPQPRLFKENSSINLTLNNLEAAAYDITLSLAGYKLFRA